MLGSRSLGPVLAAVGLLGAFATGCGEGEPGGESPRPEPSSPASGPSESGSESPDPTESESTPTGESMVADNAYVVAPVGWRVTDDSEFGLVSAQKKGGIGAVYLGDYGTVGSITLRELVDIAGFESFDGKPRVTFDAELGGAPAYHASGRGGSGITDEYAAVHGGVAVSVAFVLDPKVPADERQQLIDEVLSSFSWV